MPYRYFNDENKVIAYRNAVVSYFLKTEDFISLPKEELLHLLKSADWTELHEASREHALHEFLKEKLGKDAPAPTTFYGYYKKLLEEDKARSEGERRFAYHKKGAIAYQIIADSGLGDKVLLEDWHGLSRKHMRWEKLSPQQKNLLRVIAIKQNIDPRELLTFEKENIWHAIQSLKASELNVNGKGDLKMEKPIINSIYNSNAFKEKAKEALGITSDARLPVGSLWEFLLIEINAEALVGRNFKRKFFKGEEKEKPEARKGRQKKTGAKPETQEFADISSRFTHEVLEKYSNSFKLLITQFAKTKNWEAFEVLPEKVKAKHFTDTKLCEFIRTSKSSKNLRPRGLSIYQAFVREAKKAELPAGSRLERGSIIRSMIATLLKYNPLTGKLIEHEKIEEQMRKQREARLLLKSMYPKNVVLRSLQLDLAASGGELLKLVEATSWEGILNCRGIQPQAIFDNLAEVKAGESIAIALPQKPDRIFRDALARMGFEIVGKRKNVTILNDNKAFAKEIAPETNKISEMLQIDARIPVPQGETITLLVARRIEERRDASPIEFDNRLKPSRAMVLEIGALVEKAQTQADLEVLSIAVDDLLGYLKSQKRQPCVKKGKIAIMEAGLLHNISDAHDSKPKGAVSEQFNPENLRTAKENILAAMKRASGRKDTWNMNQWFYGNQPQKR